VGQIEERVSALQQEAETFKKYLSDLPVEAWSQPSACDRWTVADVICHVGSQGFAVSITRGLQGTVAPPEGRPPVEQHNEDEFAEQIAQRAFATKEQIGDELLPWFFKNLDESIAIFGTIGPDQWDMPCYWPPGPEPVSTLLDMRIAELAMHAWDIYSQLEPDYHLSEGTVGALIDTVPRAVRRAFRSDPDLAVPITYRLNISSPAAVGFDIVLAQEGAQIGPASTDNADVIFTCDGETYVLVMYGRLTPDAAMADGRLTFEGDSALAAGFGQRFKGG